MQVEHLSSAYRVSLLSKKDVPKIYQLYQGNPLYFEHMKAQPTLENTEEDLIVLPPGKQKQDKFLLVSGKRRTDCGAGFDCCLSQRTYSVYWSVHGRKGGAGKADRKQNHLSAAQTPQTGRLLDSKTCLCQNQSAERAFLEKEWICFNRRRKRSGRLYCCANGKNAIKQ